WFAVRLADSFDELLEIAAELLGRQVRRRLLRIHVTVVRAVHDDDEGRFLGDHVLVQSCQSAVGLLAANARVKDFRLDLLLAESLLQKMAERLFVRHAGPNTLSDRIAQDDDADRLVGGQSGQWGQQQHRRGKPAFHRSSVAYAAYASGSLRTIPDAS